MKIIKFKIKSIIATCIILFISGTAFLAGFLQENYTEQASNLRIEVNGLQTDLDRMEAKALSLRSEDVDFTYRSMEWRWDASSKDSEFSILNDTLLAEERTNYVYRIRDCLRNVLRYSNPTTILQLYRHFDYYGAQSGFIIATEEIDGYNYTIPREIWDSYISSYGMPVVEYTAFEWYGGMFSYDLIQALSLAQRPTDPDFGENFVFEDDGIDFICDYFLFYPVRILQDSIDAKLNLIEILESISSQIGLGVGLTTIAVVLSTAMANRLDQRKIELEFEKDRLDEGRKVEKKRDLISIPILIIASILSLLGVTIPLILNLFG